MAVGVKFSHFEDLNLKGLSEGRKSFMFILARPSKYLLSWPGMAIPHCPESPLLAADTALC